MKEKKKGKGTKTAHVAFGTHKDAGGRLAVEPELREGEQGMLV